MTHAKHQRSPLHVKHAGKLAKVTEKSRLWCEVATCGCVAFETRMILLTIVSVAWIVADIAMIILGVAEEL